MPSKEELLRMWSNSKPWNFHKEFGVYLDSLPDDKVKPKYQRRTNQQSKALHLGMEFIAEELNNAGYDMKKVLKQEVDIPWTKETVKEYLFKPIMKALYHHESTTDLKKTEEIEKVWDTLMRHLGEKFHIEYVPFPNNEIRQWEEVGGYKTQAGQANDYPEYDPDKHKPTI